MYFDYFDMLSGRPLLIRGVGHVRSPQLSELCVGYDGGGGKPFYNMMLSVLTWDKEHIIKYDYSAKFRGAVRLEKSGLSAFDTATLWSHTRELYRKALSFFIVEKVVWDESAHCYHTVDDDGRDIGIIDRNNFDDVRQVILQMNYIGLDKDSAPVKHSSNASKELWERAQKHLKDIAKDESRKDKPEYHLSNIVSKVCAAHPSYNLFNIYDLTIFQLYDTFFQLGYLRSSDLGERIFSNHGGEKFKFEDWLKPIFKNI